MPLTDAAARNAKPQDKPRKLSDGHSLYLLIHPKGGKYWQYQYRYGGKTKVLSIGTYPRAVQFSKNMPFQLRRRCKERAFL